MAAPRRIFLGRARSASAGVRQRVYEIPGGLEIDILEFYEIVRKRVFFEDVVFITHHKFYGWAYLLLTALCSVPFLIAVALTLATNTATGTLVLLFFASLGGIPFVVRLLLGVDVITVYGNRSKAEIHFQLRKQRARDLFRELCNKVRDAQTAAAAEIAAQEAQAAAENAPPLPPPQQPPVLSESPGAEVPPVPPATAEGGVVG